MAGKIDTHIASLGITIPNPGEAAGNYVGFVIAGNMAYLSGQVPMENGQRTCIGRVGADVSVAEAKRGAELCALMLLARLRAACNGDLDRVVRCVKLVGFVNAVEGFGEQPAVINGASDLMVKVFGDKGRHARSAIGVGSLPFNVAVEVEGIFEIGAMTIGSPAVHASGVGTGTGTGTGTYVASPAGNEIAPAPRGTVIVVHEIFGLTPHIRSVCDRLAAAGYTAVAPDLFAAQLDGGFLPYTAEGKTQGLAIKNAMGEQQMALTIAGLLDHPARVGKVAVAGFCLGGAIGWLAARDVGFSAVVGYYSVGLTRFLDKAPSCPTLMHFGRHDPSIRKAEVDALAAAWPDVEIHDYDAGHAFNRDDDAAFVPLAAALAWQRTISFLEEHMKDTST